MQDQDLIIKFKNYLEVIRNYSLYTVNNYIKDIEDFNLFIIKKKLAPSLDRVNRDRICTNYVAELTSSGYKAKSINRKVSSLRTFYNYLVSEKIIDYNYFNDVLNVKTPKKLPSFIDEEEIISLIESIDTEKDLGYRNRVIIELLYATGIRVSELCNLEVSQINLYNNTIRVFGKGKKDRIVVIYDELAEEVKHYLSYTRSNLLAVSGIEDIKNVFINYKGTPLTPRGVRKILNSVIENTTVSKHISPHMIRHSFATSMLNHGADLRSVQELLGHENLSTTQIYTHISVEAIKASFNDAFPRAKKK